MVQEKGLWGTNRTRNVFGTGEEPLGYEPHSETCSVQEKSLWGTNRTRNVFGTGEGPLGYKPHSETYSVQEKGLWGTNYSPERVWYRRGASGVRTALRNVFGTGEGSLMYGMLHKTPLVQEKGLWGTERIQRECRYKGDVIIRLMITILTEIFDNYEELQ